MAASIRFNGSPGPLQVVAGAITLSNFNNTGVLGWHWEILDKPIGSAAVIAAPFAASPSITVDVPGSYRVRLRTYADAARTVLDASDIQIVYILRAAPFAWRQPAAGETTEVDPSRGWATAREEESIDTHDYMIGGLQTAFDQVSTIELGGGVLVIRQGGATVFRFNGATGRAELRDGSAASPALVFESDPDTGVYRSGSDALAVAAGGVLAGRFILTGAQPQLSLAEGSASLPGLVFVTDTSTGIYHPTGQAIGIASGGNEVARFTASGNRPQILVTTGASPTTHPHYSFASATTTGMSFADGGLALYASGERPLLLTGTAGVPRALLQFGTAGNPSLAFDGDSATGIFRESAGVFAITTSGTERVRFAVTTSQLSTHWNPDANNTRDQGTSLLRWRSIFAGTQVDVSGGLVRADTFHVADGSAALPSYTFSSNTNTGLYRPGADSIGVALGGSDQWRFMHAVGLMPAVGGLYIGDSEAAPFALGFRVEGVFAEQFFGNKDGDSSVPAFAFDGETQTGIFYNGSTAFTQSGSEFARFNGVQNAAAGVMQGIQFFPSLSNTSTAGFDAFIVNVVQPLATGSGVKRLFVLKDAGTDRFAVMSATGAVRAGDGTVSLPGYSFINDTDSGVYRPGADQVAIATAGSLRVSISTTSVTSTLPFLGPNGSPGAPTYSFSGDTDNGLYYITTNTVGMAAGGAEVFRWEPTVAVSAQPIEFTSADLGSPAADTVRLGVPNTSGRPRFLALEDPYFGENFIATAFHDRQKFFLLPSGTVSMTSIGFQYQTSGTVSYVTPTGTSFMTACQKNSFVTAASASATADIHATTPIVAQGNATTMLGFLFHARFAVGSDYNQNTRLFVGLINTTLTLAGGTNPSSLNTNRMVGVGLNAGSTTLNVYTNDGGGTPQTTSTGITVSANDAFDVWIWMPPNSSVRHVYITRINGAAGSYSNNSFSFPPGANQWLYPHSWIATSEAVSKTLYVMRWAIEAGQ